MDRIFIKNLTIDTIIGVYKHELGNKQPINLDLELGIDAKQAALNDDIHQTADYDLIINKIIAICEQKTFKLIETLADHIADVLLKEFNVHWLKLSIQKPEAVKYTRDVGVVIERSA